MNNRIYLDNAATSWPKHQEATRAAAEFIANCGATSGRGSYASSLVADRWITDARREVATLIGAQSPAEIAFCSNGTHALNAAMYGILRPGDHVITTTAEHNSVLRPLESLRTNHCIDVDGLPADARGRASAADGEQLLRPNTRAICIGHASNVTGSVVDLAPWRQLADKTNALLIVDASQTLGYQTINAVESGIDVLAAAAHKGLRGLHGTGILCVSQSLHDAFTPLLYGGTGIQSESIQASGKWPYTVEVGNLNLPGIVSIAVAAKALNTVPESISAWKNSYLRLIEGLRSIKGLAILGIDDPINIQRRIPVVSVQAGDWQPHDLASILNDFHQIEVRAGLHCAARIHENLGTQAAGGTLRLSPGHSTTADEIDSTVDAFRQILSSGS